MWMFGLGPALFFHVLDEKYWKKFLQTNTGYPLTASEIHLS